MRTAAERELSSVRSALEADLGDAGGDDRRARILGDGARRAYIRASERG